jgi:hypothetical protein
MLEYLPDVYWALNQKWEIAGVFGGERAFDLITLPHRLLKQEIKQCPNLLLAL